MSTEIERSDESAPAGPGGFVRFRRWLLACWRGRAPLSEAFWGLAVGGHVAIFLAALAVNAVLLLYAKVTGTPAGDTGSGVTVVAFAVLMLLGLGQLLLMIVSCVSVWRCAANERNRALAWLARLFVLAIVLAILLMLLGGMRKGHDMIEERRHRPPDHANLDLAGVPVCPVVSPGIPGTRIRNGTTGVRAA